MIRGSYKSVVWLGIFAIVAMIGFTMMTGYGDGHMAIKQESAIAKNTMSYNDSQMDVIYERMMNGKQDWLHLTVDTTYHKVGKGDYTYKVLCNREFSLRAYDSGYEDWGNGYKHCFIEGEGVKEWRVTSEQAKSFLGYETRVAEYWSNENRWQVHYTEMLPSVEQGATPTDSYRGLILEATDQGGEYRIKAKYINLNIG